MRTWVESITVTFAESERPFGDDDIRTRMKAAVEQPRGAKLLSVTIVSKDKDGPLGDFTFGGEITFGRWWGR